MQKCRIFWIVAASALWVTTAQADTAEGRQAYLEGDYTRALALLTPEAEAGDPVAQNILGDAFDEGHGGTQDTAKALEWFGKAAAQGYVKAVYNLALVHEQGRADLPADLAKAGAYYDKAVALGYHFAMNNRGLMYFQGRGVAQDFDQAATLWTQAVALGNEDAMRNLGDLYRTGNGVEADTTRAMELYRQGASRGHASSMNALGVMYENGIGVPVDLVAALGVYRLSMELGFPTAAVNLAFLMTETDGYWHDPMAGLAHCFWAEGQAEPEEAEGIGVDCKSLAANLTPDEVSRAHALAETF